MGTGQRGMISRHWHWQAPWTHATLPTRVSWNFWQIFPTYDVAVNFCTNCAKINLNFRIHYAEKKRWGVWIFAPKLANYNITSIHINLLWNRFGNRILLLHIMYLALKRAYVYSKMKRNFQNIIRTSVSKIEIDMSIVSLRLINPNASVIPKILM